MIKKLLLCCATIFVATTSFAADNPDTTLKACLASPIVKTPIGYDLCYLNYTNALSTEAKSKFVTTFYATFLGSTIPGFKPPTGTTEESDSSTSTSSQPQKQEQQRKQSQPASIKF